MNLGIFYSPAFSAIFEHARPIFRFFISGVFSFFRFSELQTTKNTESRIGFLFFCQTFDARNYSQNIFNTNLSATKTTESLFHFYLLPASIGVFSIMEKIAFIVGRDVVKPERT